MATDFLVGLLLLCSASVNLLALGAFWITPALRNGLANRFTVNLLFVNIVCCFVLAPSLLLNTITFSTEINTEPVNQFVLNESLFEPTGVQSEYMENRIKFTEFRSWGLDFVVAAGALSVLLVVGDTWYAVTDPLRYHTRLTEKKALVAVALTWVVGAVFGVASAFRSDHNLNPYDVYNMVYSYAYFTLAIMIPFCMVCVMYWRIFSEARESGQRMRQNGSSPLLQSALNLAQVSAATAQQCTGLTMKIDGGTHNAYGSSYVSCSDSSSNEKANNNISKDDDNNNNDTIEPLLSSPNTLTHLSATAPNNKWDKSRETSLYFDNNKQSQTNFLTLTSSSHSEQIRRNFSAKNLVIENLDIPQMDLRHASSVPNLCNKMDKFDLTPQIVLPLPQVHVPPRALRYMSSIRHRLSNASSLFKYREESRAARISILVIIMFLVSYLPYGVLVLLQGHNDLIDTYNQSLLAIFSVVLANLSSPFIFAYRNKRVRRGVLRLLGIEKQATERLQKFQTSTIKRKTTTFINRSASKASTYSGNSCKYLSVTGTPLHNTTITINGSFIVEVDKLSPCYEETSGFSSPNFNSIAQVHGMNIVTTEVQDRGMCKAKKSILKRVCDTSKILGCNCAKSSASTLLTSNCALKEKPTQI